MGKHPCNATLQVLIHPLAVFAADQGMHLQQHLAATDMAPLVLSSPPRNGKHPSAATSGSAA